MAIANMTKLKPDEVVNLQILSFDVGAHVDIYAPQHVVLIRSEN